MAIYEVAQMVAKIGADTSEFKSQLSKVEDKLVELSEVMGREASKGEKALTSVWEGTAKEAADAFQRISQAESNLFEYQKMLGEKGLEDSIRFYNERMSAYDAHTNEYKEASQRSARVQIEQEQLITKSLKAEAVIRTNVLKASAIAAGGAWREAIREMDMQQGMHQAMKIVTAPVGVYSSSDREAASAKLVQLAKEEAIAIERAEQETTVSVERAAKEKVSIAEREASQRSAALANLARFEYEQGRLSVEAYKVFLQKRMADFEEYSIEWRAASTQLIAVDKELAQQRVAFHDEADAKILARERELASQRLAVEREVDAMMGDSYAKFVERVGVESAKIAAGHNKGQASSGIGHSMLGGIGNAAAGVTAIEAASAVMSTGFNHNITEVANNTLMTTDSIKSMREETLLLKNETGQATDDIAKGWMHAYNFTSNAVDSIKELTWSNKEATATGAQTEDVTNALATSLSVFGESANKSANYMDVLHHASAAGNMTIQQFVASAGPALAIAASLHDKLYSATTAVSLLTTGGFNPAESATQVKSLYSHIAEPADKARKYIIALSNEFKRLNPKSNIDLQFDFSQQGIQLKTLMGVLKDLEIVTHGRANEMYKVLPALRGGIGGTTIAQMLGVGPNGSSAAEKRLADMKDLQLRTSGAGSETQGIYDRMQLDPGQKWKEFIAQLETKFIPIGEKATKIFVQMEPGIEHLADSLLHIISVFQSLPDPVQRTISVIGGLVILEKVTGFMTALRVPVAFTSSIMSTIKLMGPLKEAFALTATGAGTLGESLTAVGIGGGVAEGVATALLVAFNPLTLALAGVALVVGGLVYLYKRMSDSGVATTQSLIDLADKHYKNAEAGKANAKETQNLLSQYTKLYSEQGPKTREELGRLHDLGNQIAEKSPYLVEAYDSEGNAILRMGDKAKTVTNQLNAMNKAAIDAVRTKALLQASDTAAQKDSNATDIARLKWSLQTGKVPVEDKANGGWNFRYADQPGDMNNPYTSTEDNPWASGLSDLGKTQYKTPFTRQGTPEELSGIRAKLDTLSQKQDSLNSTYADFLSQSANARLGQVGETPGYVKGMLGDVGKQIGRDCGVEISHYLGTKVSSLDTASRAVYPNDQGNYPEGTIMHANPDSSRDRYKKGHYWAVHYEDGSAHRLESNVVGKDVVSDDRLLSQADIKAATWGGRTHAYMPTVNDTNNSADGVKSVTPEDLEAAQLRIKNADAEKKHQIHLAKMREQLYEGQIAHLNKLLALDNKSQSLDSNNNYTTVHESLYGEYGSLKGLSKSKANYLEKRAKEEDTHEHLKYVDTVIQKAKDKVSETNAPQNVKDTVSSLGIDWDKWKAFGDVATFGPKLADGFTIAQHKLLDFSKQIEVTSLILKSKKAVEDAALQERLSLPENRALKGAIDLAGGQQKWQQYGFVGKDGTDPSSKNLGPFAPGSHSDYGKSLLQDSQSKINTENQKFLRELTLKHDKYMSEFNREFDPKSYNAGQEAVNDWKKTNSSDPATEQKIRNEADFEEKKDASKVLLQAEKQLQITAAQTSNTLADLHNPLMKSVHDWEAANHDALERIRKDWGTVEDAAIQTYEEELKAQGVKQRAVDLGVQTSQLNDKHNSMIASGNVYNTAGDKAIAEYLASEQGLADTQAILLDTTGTLADAQKAYETELKASTNSEILYNQSLERRQALVKGLADGVMGSIQKAFNPDPQARGDAQTKVYDLQSQKMQYQMDEMRWKQQYKNDPNDPYIKRLKDIQSQIDQTQNKLHGMGNTMTSVFRRLFGGIYDSFKQTLVKMAQEYLQSQLLQYLTRQVGTGAGFKGGGGGGGGGGGIMGLLTMGLGAVLGGIGGGGGGGASNGGSTYVPGSGGTGSNPGAGLGTYHMNYGGDVGYASKGWDVPGTEGKGDTVPAMLAPREMVLPVPIANRLRSMSDGKSNGGTTYVTNNFNQTVNTPDYQGFRSSKSTIFQNAKSVFK